MSEPLNPEQLRSLTPLNVLSEQQWRELRGQLVPQPLLAGQSLFRLGDQARVTYYLLAGELHLQSADGQQQLLRAGTEASCHPLSPSLPRLHEVRALNDASVLALDSATLNRLLTWRLAADWMGAPPPRRRCGSCPGITCRSRVPIPSTDAPTGGGRPRPSNRATSSTCHC
jgi:hypothetical protein